jgi:hypothetical protein
MSGMAIIGRALSDIKVLPYGGGRVCYRQTSLIMPEGAAIGQS